MLVPHTELLHQHTGRVCGVQLLQTFSSHHNTFYFPYFQNNFYTQEQNFFKRFSVQMKTLNIFNLT